MGFSHAAYRRNGQAVLTDPIELGDGVIIPAVKVDSVLNFDMIRLGYTYAFVQTDHVRIGGGVSAYVLPIEYGVELVRATLRPRSSLAA